MKYTHIKYHLSFLVVLVMVFSMMAFPAAASAGNAASIQERIDAILDSFGITDDMTDDEIVLAITSRDGETIRTTMDEIASIESDARTLTETELAELDVDLYGRFCSVLEQLTTPAIITSHSLLDGTVTVADSANSSSVSGNTVTITAKGGLISKKTNNITITNESGATAILAFDYTASKANSCTVAGVASTSGTYSGTIAAGESITIVLVSNNGFSNTTATLTLSNFSLVAAAASSNVTFEYSGGSITVDGTDTASGSIVEIPLTGEVLTATPDSGYTFLGWADGDGKLLSTASSYTLIPATDMTVKAAFASAATDAWFLAGGSYLYNNLNAAAAKAATLSNKTVVLMHNGTLPSSANETNGVYTIPAGVTLLIPYNDANTLCTTAPTYNESESNPMPAPTIFRTLTMAEGANITVNGAISLSAQMVGYQPTSSNGAPYGPLSHIAMNSGSSITVNSGGNLYCWGIISGSGSVTMNPGSSVYQNFQVTDFRGGSASLSMEGNSQEVFPLSQYYVQNVEVPLTIHSGAKVAVKSAMLIMGGMQKPAVTFLGDSNGGLFQLTSGSVTMDYQEDTDRMHFTVNGDVSIASETLSFKYGLASIDLNTADYVLPLNPNISILIESGSNVDISQDIAVLPGTEVIIEEDATAALSNNANMFIYDLDQWGPYVMEAVKMRPVRWSYANGSTAKRTEASLADASVRINGTLDATNGSIYTTTAGANIHSTESGVIKTTAGTKVETYQATYNGEISYSSIGITTAKLKNGDGTYTETTGASSTTYKYINGFWHSGGACTGGTATCSKKAVCTICGKEYGDLANHTEVIDAAVAPTCTTSGLTEGSHCSVCSEVIVAQTVVAANGHTEVTDAAVAPTCTATGLTEGSHCSVCNTVIVAQTVVAANGHSYGEGVITTQPTVDAAGVKTFTCTVCGDTKTEAVPALTAVAKIGSTRYASLAVAYEALIEGDTVVILDGSASSENVTFAKSCTVDASALDNFNFNFNVATGFEAVDKQNGIWYVHNTGLFDIYASNIKAGDSLDLFFYIDATNLTEDWSNYSARIVRYRPGNISETVTVPGSEWVSYQDGTLARIRYNDIAAKEMTDKIFITILKDGKKVSNPRMESIENYALRVLKNIGIGTVDGEKAALRTTVVDMLKYGAECQDYFKDYNIANRADANLGEFAQYASENVTPTPSGTDGPYVAGTSVTAESSLILTFYFNSNVTAEMNAYISYTDHYGTVYSDVRIPGSEFRTGTYDGKTVIGVDVKNLAVADGRCMVSCSVKKSDGTVVASASGSVESYIATDKGETTALQMLMNFIVSAYDYFHYGETT